MTAVYRDIPSIDLLTRESRPIPLATAVEPADAKPLPYRVPIDRNDAKFAVTATVPNSKIRGEPIELLDDTRNPAVEPIAKYGLAVASPYGNPNKLGTYEQVGAILEIQRVSYDTQARRQRALLGQFQLALQDLKPTPPKLGISGSGFGFYRSPRLKPAMAAGYLEYMAPVRGVAVRGQSWIDFTIPLGTLSALAKAGEAADTRMGLSMAQKPVKTDLDRANVKPGGVITASTHPAPYTRSVMPWVIGGVVLFALFFAGGTNG